MTDTTVVVDVNSHLTNQVSDSVKKQTGSTGSPPEVDREEESKKMSAISASSSSCSDEPNDSISPSPVSIRKNHNNVCNVDDDDVDLRTEEELQQDRKSAEEGKSNPTMRIFGFLKASFVIHNSMSSQKTWCVD